MPEQHARDRAARTARRRDQPLVRAVHDRVHRAGAGRVVRVGSGHGRDGALRLRQNDRRACQPGAAGGAADGAERGLGGHRLGPGARHAGLSAGAARGAVRGAAGEVPGAWVLALRGDRAGAGGVCADSGAARHAVVARGHSVACGAGLPAGAGDAERRDADLNAGAEGVDRGGHGDLRVAEPCLRDRPCADGGRGRAAAAHPGTVRAVAGQSAPGLQDVVAARG